MKRVARSLQVMVVVLWVLASLFWAGGLARRGGVVADKVQPGSGSSGAPVLAATPTGAPYPVGDVILRGHVYKAGEPGLLQPIPGANVGVLICSLPQNTTTTAADGSFGLYLAAADLDPCGSVIIDIWAKGYSRYSLALSVAELRADPTRDFSLAEMAGSLFLPIIFR